jgi:cell division protein FtsB
LKDEEHQDMIQKTQAQLNVLRDSNEALESEVQRLE